MRKNRGNSPGSPACVGVDINRNFDIAWNHGDYYRPDAAANADVSDDPCEFQHYKGSRPFSEAETTAVRDLVLNNKPTAFVDVHLFGRQVMYPWGMERNQVINPNKNFANVDENHLPAVPLSGRDGMLGDAYGEFVPVDQLDRIKQLATMMADEIVASAGASLDARKRSTYTVGQTVDFPNYAFETWVGGADDWVFSRQFSDPRFREVFAFTLEAGRGKEVAGDPGDGGFFPPFATHFPKVNREIHAALFGLLTKGGL